MHVDFCPSKPAPCYLLCPGDSYTVGFGNVGGNSSCNATVCEIKRISGLCYPELDSENAAVSWGPITAANLEADYQVCPI